MVEAGRRVGVRDVRARRGLGGRPVAEVPAVGVASASASRRDGEGRGRAEEDAVGIGRHRNLQGGQVDLVAADVDGRALRARDAREVGRGRCVGGVVRV